MRLRKPLVFSVLAALLAGGVRLGVLHWWSAVPVTIASRPLETSTSGNEYKSRAALAAYAESEPRMVKPLPRPASMEEFAAQRRAIELELPHVSPRDYSRLRHFCPADFNRDDTVDEADLTAYMERWQTGDGATAYLADLNRDEVLDSSDINEFLSAYFNNDCDTQRQKAVRASLPPDRVRRIARREGGERRVFDNEPRPSMTR